LEPVSVDDVPDYQEVIDHPMDLGTIAEKVAARRYTAPAQVGSGCAWMARWLAAGWMAAPVI
jgi:hypothetical protein